MTNDLTTHTTREAWLELARELLRPLFTAQGAKVGPCRVSCGWPSKMALSRTKRRIGEAWSDRASADEMANVFISPVLVDPVRVVGVLAHELVHVSVGTEAGHKKPFSQLGKAIGLTGKPSSMEPGEELQKRIREEFLPKLGKYPHAKLEGQGPVKKQSTRLLKLECPDGSGYCVRITMKWLESLGAPICPCCGNDMVEG